MLRDDKIIIIIYRATKSTEPFTLYSMQFAPDK